MHTLDEAEWFNYDLQGTADVFLLQKGKDIFGCVVAEENHLVWLHERLHYVFDKKRENMCHPTQFLFKKMLIQ